MNGSTSLFEALLMFVLLAFIIAIHWLERESLKDNHDGYVSFTDVIYFTMISATTTGYDVTDVYDETVTFRNDGTTEAPEWVPVSVRFNGADVEVATITEPIAVGDGTTEDYVIHVVPHHGPIIPDSFVYPEAGSTEGSALSVRYTGHVPSNELAFFTGLLDRDQRRTTRSPRCAPSRTASRSTCSSARCAACASAAPSWCTPTRRRSRSPSTRRWGSTSPRARCRWSRARSRRISCCPRCRCPAASACREGRRAWSRSRPA